MSRLVLLLFTCGVSVSYVLCQNLNVGASCTIRGKPGICKVLADCPAAKADAANDLPPVRCRRGYPPIVCCSQDVPKIVEKVCPPIPQSYLTIQKDGRGKAKDHCIDWLDLIYRCTDGTSFPGTRPPKIRVDECNHAGARFIVGGDPAKPREFPHQVLLGYTPEPTRTLWDCGGTLISDQWVVTAGHCIWSKTGGDVSKARMGIIDVDTTHPDHDYDIVEIVKHNNYIGTSVYDDIALLKLNKKVKFSQDVIPACLDYDGLHPNEVVATGFGLTDENDSDSKSKKLLKVKLESFDLAKCSKSHPVSTRMAMGVKNDTQMCYGSTTGNKDTCWGDSGGPIQTLNQQVYCTYILVGVTSFGKGCGTQNVPGVYTRVKPYVKWIEDVVWP